MEIQPDSRFLDSPFDFSGKRLVKKDFSENRGRLICYIHEE